MRTSNLTDGFEALGVLGRKFYEDNKAHIFTGLSIAGTIATGVISAKDGAKAARRIDQKAIEIGRDLTVGEKIRLCWKDYIDAGLVCAGSCAATVASDAINTRTIADRTTLLIASEKAYEKLSKKTKEMIGKEKFQEMKKDEAEEKVRAHPEIVNRRSFDNAPRVGNGQLTPFVDGYSMLPVWTNLDYLEKWVMKLNEMMRDTEPRNRNTDYYHQKKGVPYKEIVSAYGYGPNEYNTPERKDHGWNKGYAKDGSEDDEIGFTTRTMEYEPGFPVMVIVWNQDPVDMTLGALIKSSEL